MSTNPAAVGPLTWASRHDSNYLSSMFMRRADGFGVGVVDANNHPLPLYRDAQGQLWVAGTKGQEFKIEIMVPDQGRYAALLTVDGANQIDGTRSGGDMRTEQVWVQQAPDTRGKNCIPGWLNSSEDAAHFRFGDRQSAYVAQMHQGVENTGVIGCRFAFEKVRSDSGGRPRSPVLGSSEGLGTEYGRRVQFRTTSVPFTIDHSRGYVDVIVRYASEDQLIRAGYSKVDGFVPPPISAAYANPFPEEHLARTFAPPPASWQGH